MSHATLIAPIFVGSFSPNSNTWYACNCIHNFHSYLWNGSS